MCKCNGNARYGKVFRDLTKNPKFSKRVSGLVQKYSELTNVKLLFLALKDK